MPNRYDSIDQFFSANQKSLTPEEQKIAQQHSAAPNSAVSQELNYIVGNDASVEVIADTPSAFGKLGTDYLSIFGQTVQEGLSKLNLPLLLLLITGIGLYWLNSYSPATELQISGIHRIENNINISNSDSISNYFKGHKLNEICNNGSPVKYKNESNLLKSGKKYRSLDIVQTIPIRAIENLRIISVCASDAPFYSGDKIDSLHSPYHLNWKRPVNNIHYQCYWVFNTDTLISKETSNTYLLLQDMCQAIDQQKDSTLTESRTRKKGRLDSYTLLQLASHSIDSDSKKSAFLIFANRVVDKGVVYSYRNSKWQFRPKSSEPYCAETSDRLYVHLYINRGLPGIAETQKTPEQPNLPSNVTQYLKTHLYIPQGTFIQLVADNTLQKENRNASLPLEDLIKICNTTSVTTAETQHSAPALLPGTLLYRIGDQDIWKIYTPGCTTTIQADRTGYLEFQINDHSVSDYTGDYRMEVRVDKKD